MDIFETIVLTLHVLAAISVIGLVLIQQGKGADMGSGFGSGASNTVFGSGGAGNFLTKATTSIAIIFFITSFGLAFFAKQKSLEISDLGIPQVEQVQDAPDLMMPDLDSDVPVLETDASEIPGLLEDEIPEAIDGDSGG